MGYYTDYKLKVDTNDDTVLGQIAENLDEITSYDWEDLGGGEFILDGAKWYNSDKDMLEVSKLHPTVLFTLYGEGEENGDLWITYYKNGKKQHCEAIITYDEFDEEKLK